MNENFVEEENTVYEIDPDCQIVSLCGEKKMPESRWSIKAGEKKEKQEINLRCLICLLVLCGCC